MKRLLIYAANLAILGAIFYLMSLVKETDRREYIPISEDLVYYVTSSKCDDGEQYIHLYNLKTGETLPEKYDKLVMDECYLDGTPNDAYIRFFEGIEYGYIDPMTGNEIVRLPMKYMLGRPSSAIRPIVAVGINFENEVEFFDLKNQDTVFKFEKTLCYHKKNIGIYGDFIFLLNRIADYGVIDMNLDTIVPFKYETIEMLSADGPPGLDKGTVFIAESSNTYDVYSTNGELLLASLDYVTALTDMGKLLCSKNGVTSTCNYLGELIDEHCLVETCGDESITTIKDADGNLTEYLKFETYKGTGVINTSFDFVVEPVYNDVAYLGNDIFKCNVENEYSVLVKVERDGCVESVK